LPHSVCSAFRFSQPLSGLLPWSAISLVSCRIRLWVSTLQSFPLPKSWGLFRASIPSWCYLALAPTGCPDGLTGFQRVNTASVHAHQDKPSAQQTTGDAVPRSGRPSLRVAGRAVLLQLNRLLAVERSSGDLHALLSRDSGTVNRRFTCTRPVRCTDRGSVSRPKPTHLASDWLTSSRDQRMDSSAEAEKIPPASDRPRPVRR